MSTELNYDVRDSIRITLDYIRSERIHLHYFGEKCFVNVSSSHIPPSILGHRKVLETAGVLRKSSKANLARSGVHINAGFHGRYAFWEIPCNVINEYVAALKE